MDNASKILKLTFTNFVKEIIYLIYQDEADQRLNEALKLYSNRQDLQQQLVLMNAELQLQRNNVDAALSMLQSIEPSIY